MNLLIIDGILYVSIFPKNKDRLFDSECVNAFQKGFTKESFMCLRDDSFETNLWGIIPRKKQFF